MSSEDECKWIRNETVMISLKVLPRGIPGDNWGYPPGIHITYITTEVARAFLDIRKPRAT
jgi:hypothetical protein